MGQQRLHQLQIASEHCGVQSGVAAAIGVGIRALLEQNDRDISLAAVRCQNQRAGTIGQGIVGVRARGQQEFGGLGIARPRREQQRRAAAAKNVIV